MSSRRGRRGNRRLKLEKARLEQNILEEELVKLKESDKPQDIAEKIRDFVAANGTDPMLAEDNPFKANPNGCCQKCSVL